MNYDYSFLNNKMVPISLIADVTKIEIKRIQLETCIQDDEQLVKDLQKAASLVGKKRAHERTMEKEGYPGYANAMEFVLNGDNFFSMDDFLGLYSHLICESATIEKHFCSNESARKFECLLRSYEKLIENRSVHPLLIIALYMCDFIRLAPLKRGNEVVAELLTWKLLCLNGYDIGKYAQIEREAIGQIFFSDVAKQENVWLFVEAFMQALLFCYEKAGERIRNGHLKCKTKKERIENIVVGSSLPVTKSDIYEILEDVSITTLEAQLADLCRADVIRKEGSTRLAAYMKNFKEISDGKE